MKAFPVGGPAETERARERIVAEGNTAEYPRDRTISKLFEEQVTRTPEGVALVFGTEQLTYCEVNERANQLARHLKRRGVGPGALVGICLDRSFEAVVGILGTLKAGGVYVPLDPTYPKDRLTFMLQDSAARVLLTREILKEGLPATTAEKICLDRDWSMIAREDATNPDRVVGSEDLAYVIYTSGSTGKPKGVMAPQRGVINRLFWMWRTYPFQQGEALCQKTTLSFVDHVWELFGPLLAGVPLVIIPQGVERDPERLIEILAERWVSRMVLVPSLLRVLLKNKPDLGARLPKLKYWQVSGEALGVDLLEQFAVAVPKGILLNLYGSSEVAADATWYDARDPRPEHIVPIGRPIDNMRVYILNEQFKPIVAGAAGELYVGGDGLARGYLNQPDLTAQKFIRNPFGRGQLYRTGDLGRYLANGDIEFLGRVDHQIKIRGFRIEPGEVESALRQHPMVNQAVVVAREEDHGDKQLVAYLVGGQVATAEVRDFLTKLLPDYMIPSNFVILDSLPLTPNGKIDRKALPTPDRARPELKHKYVPPTTLLQQQLVDLWEELLDVRPIGINDNFFDLGGHSLLAVHLLTSVQQTYGKTIPAATLFRGATVQQLEKVLQEDENRPRSLLVEIQGDGSKRPFFYLHGDWTGGFYCLKLAHALGPDQPFYALQPYELAGQHSPETMERLATSYVEAIRSVQPEGPYFLGALGCLAIPAYEMSRQLQAQGQEVAALVFVHPDQVPRWTVLFRRWMGRLGTAIGLGPSQQVACYTYVKDLGYFMRDVATLGPKGLLQLAFGTIRESTKRFTPFSGRRKSASTFLLRPGPLLPESLTRRQEGADAFHWAVAGYRVHRSPGRVTVLRAEELPEWQKRWYPDDETLGWNKIIRDVEVRVLPGTTQESLITEHSELLAEELKQVLTRAQVAS